MTSTARAIGSASRPTAVGTRAILGVHQPHDFERRERIDLLRGRVAGFGRQAGHAVRLACSVFWCALDIVVRRSSRQW